jgi:transposase
MDSELEMTEPERRELEQAAKRGHCWLLRRRAQAILLLAQGRAPAEVADILETRRESIYQWRRNWRENGMAGLAEGLHTGRPSALDAEMQCYLEQLAEAGTYSIRQLMTLMQARYPGFGVHPSTLRRILRERGFRWKRTRYSLKKTAAAGLSAGQGGTAGMGSGGRKGRTGPGVF